MLYYVKYNIKWFSYVNNDDICERRSCDEWKQAY